MPDNDRLDGTYEVLVHDEGDGMLWAELPALPGLFASGEDMDELREAIAEAAGIYLSSADRKVTAASGSWSEPAGERTEVRKLELTRC